MIQALDILAIQIQVEIEGKFEGKKVRRIDKMVEFTGIDNNTQDLKFNVIYSWDPKTDTFKSSGRSFVHEKLMTRCNWDEAKLKSELENRRKLLEYMVEKGMDEYDVVLLIQSYYADPENTIKLLENRT